MTPRPRSHRVSDVEAHPVRWIWEGRIACGHMTLLAGSPGTGKSQISCDVAAHITTGGDWPDGGKAPRGARVHERTYRASASRLERRPSRERPDQDRTPLSKLVRLIKPDEPVGCLLAQCRSRPGRD